MEESAERFLGFSGIGARLALTLALVPVVPSGTELTRCPYSTAVPFPHTFSAVTSDAELLRAPLVLDREFPTSRSLVPSGAELTLRPYSTKVPFTLAFSAVTSDAELLRAPLVLDRKFPTLSSWATIVVATTAPPWPEKGVGESLLTAGRAGR